MDVDLRQPWQVLETTTDDFLVTMAGLGNPIQEVSLVGSFADADDSTVRTASRDIDLPFHRDGIFTQSIADLQGGMYVARPNVDVVGMYCLRDNQVPVVPGSGYSKHEPCYTILADDEAGENVVAKVDLRPGQALVWDNRLWHGRRGPVGNRMLIRFWITCPALYEARP